MPADLPILIIGAGQAGAMAAGALRGHGYAGRILMLGDEAHPAYERPPLSKSALLDAAGAALAPIHAPEQLSAQAIEWRGACRVDAINPAARLAHLGNGETIAYSQALIATGGRAREWPQLPIGTPHVHYLRTLDDARALRESLRSQRALVVLGAGFLGLEIASTARALGLDVTVIESAPRVLPRAVPPALSAWLAARAAAAGVALRLDTRVQQARADAHGVTLVLEGGEQLQAPLLVVAIGQVPNVTLAASAGVRLHAGNGGICVDAHGRTSVPGLFAAGDCASQHRACADAELRLESWQSANEQARLVAAAMLEQPAPPAATPWFWTDQFGLNLQMLGLPADGLRYLTRGDDAVDAQAPRFLLLGIDDGNRLRHVIAVNAGAELRPLRPLVDAQVAIDPAAFTDTTAALRQLARDALAAAATAPHP